MAQPAFLFVDDVSRFRDSGAIVVRLPTGLRSRRKLFAALSRRLKLPGYFGKNWDALEECLRDLSWVGDAPRVAVAHCSLPLRARSAARKTYLQVLRSATSFTRDEGSPRLVVVFPESERAEVTRLLASDDE